MKYNKDEDYCSFSPDEIAGVRFNYACFLHDRQYRNEVVNRKTRKQADIDLRNNIYKKFETKNKVFLGFFVSWIYYIIVRIFGNKHWQTN